MNRQDKVNNCDSVIVEEASPGSSPEMDPGSKEIGKSVMTFDQAFELTGHGRFNMMVLATCGMIMLNVSMESIGMSYVITSAECDLQLTSLHKGLVTAAAFIGIVSTSFLWGYLGDRVGRRAVMLPAMVASACFSLASSFSTSVWLLIVLRVLTGCLVSASSATVYAYLGEMHVSAHRATAIAWGSAFISFSFIILPGLAWLIIPGKWSFAVGSMQLVPWRVFVWCWCAPGLLAALLLLLLPESPRFLYSAKGPDEAMPILAKMYAWNHRKSVHHFPVEFITGETFVKDGERLPGGFLRALKNITILFKPPLLKCVIISNISMFAVFMLSSGLYVWVPDILNSMLLSTSDTSSSICEIIYRKFEETTNSTVSNVDKCKAQVAVSVFPISMAMGAVFAVVYLAIGVFINRVGKKTMYCGIMLVGGVATVGAGFAVGSGAAVTLLVVALCTGCAASVLAAISVDVFPTSLRAMAMCVMYMVGRSGAVAGTNLLGATLNTRCQLAFSLLGLFTAGSTALMGFWPRPEQVRQVMEQRGLTY